MGGLKAGPLNAAGQSLRISKCNANLIDHVSSSTTLEHAYRAGSPTEAISSWPWQSIS